MNKRLLIVLLIALALAVAVGIFWLSSQSTDDSAYTSRTLTRWLLYRFYPGFAGKPREERWALFTQYNNVMRKVAHCLEFALLGMILCLLLRFLRVRRAPLWALLGGAAYAVTDELHQVVSSRGPMVEDALLDTGGVLLGVGLALGLMRLWRFVRAGRRGGGGSGPDAAEKTLNKPSDV